MKTDKERIRDFIDYTKKTKNALGILIGDANGTRFNHVESGRNNISEKLAVDIVNVFPEVSYQWLVKGEGEMLVSENNLKHENILEIEKVIDYVIKNTSQLLSDSNFKNWYDNIVLKAQVEVLKQIRSGQD